MKRYFVYGLALLVLAAGALHLTGAFRSDPLQQVYRDGPRAVFLDTRTVALGTDQETGLRYLDVTVRQTYDFTPNYDLTRYFLLTESRQFQPVTATGCDKDGNVLEL